MALSRDSLMEGGHSMWSLAAVRVCTTWDGGRREEGGGRREEGGGRRKEKEGGRREERGERWRNESNAVIGWSHCKLSRLTDD